MKRTFKLIFLILIILVVLSTAVNAAEANVALETQKTIIKAGETFELVLSAECEDGINGLKTTINYDNNKLEKVKIEETDTSKWTNMGEDNEIAIMGKSPEKITKDNIVKITFKLKEGVSDGEKIDISTSEIEIGTYTNEIKKVAAKNYTFTVGKDEKEEQTGGEEVKLTKIKITKEPVKKSYNAGEKVDLTGIEITATYSDGTTKKVTDYKYTPNRELTAEDKSIIIAYTENGVTETVEQKIEVIEDEDNEDDKENFETDVPKNNDKSNIDEGDETLSDKDYPETGAKRIILPIALVVILLVGSYIGYKKYKEI